MLKRKSQRATGETSPSTHSQLGWTEWLDQPKPPESPVSRAEAAHEIEAPAEKSLQVLSVGELNRTLRQMIETHFGTIFVQGEISNFKAHTSGHYYFSLKDSEAQVSAVMFRGAAGQLRFRPEDGMQVIARGRVTVYEVRGQYQINCESLEPVGAGQLQKAYEQLKEKLRQEGLFEAQNKKKLPELPRHIAIVTSPTGAAIRDILNVLSRRNRLPQLTIVPCRVQGSESKLEIARAIASADRLPGVDLIIVGRGGGSIEDLWAFNEEVVARAIHACATPIISAVGHEIDTTIADFVADVRAPTPSAAAEIAVPSVEALIDVLRSLRVRAGNTLKSGIALRASRLRQFSGRVVDPRRKINDGRMRLDELVERMTRETTRSLRLRRREIDRTRMFLHSLHPLRTIDRGFAAVIDGRGRVISTASSLMPDMTFQILLKDGAVTSKVQSTELYVSGNATDYWAKNRS